VPNDPVPAADLMADAIKRESTRRVGLGSVNRRYFCFHTGVGFDAAVVGRVERQATLKRWAGHPLFVWAGLATWLRGYDRRRPHFGLTFADGEPVPDGYFTIVLNCAIGRALRGTPVAPSRRIDVRTDLAGVEVAAETPFPYQVDGDFLGDTRRLSFRHEPDALDLVVP
jgi:diacylglycerol kinase family enzyme